VVLHRVDDGDDPAVLPLVGVGAGRALGGQVARRLGAERHRIAARPAAQQRDRQEDHQPDDPGASTDGERTPDPAAITHL